MNKKFPSPLKGVVKSIFEIERVMGFLFVIGPIILAIWYGIFEEENSSLNFQNSQQWYIVPVFLTLTIFIGLPFIIRLFKWKREPTCPHGKRLPVFLTRNDYESNFTTYEECSLNYVRAVIGNRIPKKIKIGKNHIDKIPLFNHKCPECLSEFDYLLKQIAIESLEKLRRIENLRAMNAYDFESLVLEIFKRLGWETESTPRSGDFGSDGYLYDPFNNKWVLQCKRYIGNSQIGPKFIRELLGTVVSQNCYKGLLVTTSHFSVGAYKAKSQSEGKIELLSEQGLLKLISYAFPLDGSKPPKINTLKEFINL